MKWNTNPGVNLLSKIKMKRKQKERKMRTNNPNLKALGLTNKKQTKAERKKELVALRTAERKEMTEEQRREVIKKEKRAKKPQRDPDAGKNKKWIVEMGFREWLLKHKKEESMHELWNSFEFDYEGFKDEDFPDGTHRHFNLWVQLRTHAKKAINVKKSKTLVREARKWLAENKGLKPGQSMLDHFRISEKLPPTGKKGFSMAVRRTEDKQDAPAPEPSQGSTETAKASAKAPSRVGKKAKKRNLEEEPGKTAKKRKKKGSKGAGEQEKGKTDLGIAVTSNIWDLLEDGSD